MALPLHIESKNYLSRFRQELIAILAWLHEFRETDATDDPLKYIELATQLSVFKEKQSKLQQAEALLEIISIEAKELIELGYGKLNPEEIEDLSNPKHVNALEIVSILRVRLESLDLDTQIKDFSRVAGAYALLEPNAENYSELKADFESKLENVQQLSIHKKVVGNALDSLRIIEEALESLRDSDINIFINLHDQSLGESVPEEEKKAREDEETEYHDVPEILRQFLIRDENGRFVFNVIGDVASVFDENDAEGKTKKAVENAKYRFQKSIRTVCGDNEEMPLSEVIEQLREIMHRSRIEEVKESWSSFYSELETRYGHMTAGEFLRAFFDRFGRSPERGWQVADRAFPDQEIEEFTLRFEKEGIFVLGRDFKFARNGIQISPRLISVIGRAIRVNNVDVVGDLTEDMIREELGIEDDLEFIDEKTTRDGNYMLATIFRGENGRSIEGKPIFQVMEDAIQFFTGFKSDDYGDLYGLMEHYRIVPSRNGNMASLVDWIKSEIGKSADSVGHTYPMNESSLAGKAAIAEVNGFLKDIADVFCRIAGERPTQNEEFELEKYRVLVNEDDSRVEGLYAYKLLMAFLFEAMRTLRDNQRDTKPSIEEINQIKTLVSKVCDYGVVFNNGNHKVDVVDPDDIGD